MSTRIAPSPASRSAMAPTLSAGDNMLVDHAECERGLRDGIYVLRADDASLVKRPAIPPFGGRVVVQSDNANYPDWPDRALDCIGRVSLGWAAYSLRRPAG